MKKNSFVLRGADAATCLYRLNLNGSLLQVVTSAHLSGKGGSGLPAGRGTGGGLLHHLVDLLEGQTLGLGDQEVGVDESASAETSPDEEDGGLQVALIGTDHVGGDDGDDGVPQPVGSSGQSNTTRSDRQREDLTNDNPGTGTPGGGEEEDEDGDESNLSVDGGNVVGNVLGRVAGIGVGLVETNGNTNDGDQELTDKHTKSTENEDSTATKSLNGPERQRSGADVDQGEDQGDQEGVADGAGRLEEGSGVVEDEVDTSPLLHHLERGTEDGSSQVRLAGPERTLEAVGPGAEPGGGGDQGTLVLLVGDNLSKLVLDILRVLRLASDTGQGVDSLLDLTLLDEVTGRVGEEEQTATENQSPGELNGDGDTVGASVVVVLGAVDNARGEQDTNGNAELVTSNESTTDLARAL